MFALYLAQKLAHDLRAVGAPEFAQRRAAKLVAKFTRLAVYHATH